MEGPTRINLSLEFQNDLKLYGGGIVQRSFLIGILLILAGCGPQKTKVVETLDFNSIYSDAILSGAELTLQNPITPHIVAVCESRGQNRCVRAPCTAVLLANNFVVTAAHCVSDDPRNMSVLFGTNLISPVSEVRSVIAGARSQYWEKNQYLDKNQGDIAVLRYSGVTPANYKPAQLLADPRVLTSQTKVILAGFGVNNSLTKSGSGVLRAGLAQISNPQFAETEVLIDQKNKNGACYGDSGGPIFIFSNNKYYFWGIVSRGFKDEDDHCDDFSVATNVMVYKAWIQRVAYQISRQP